MQEKLPKNLRIFAVEKFKLLPLIAMTLKFTQKEDQS